MRRMIIGGLAGLTLSAGLCLWAHTFYTTKITWSRDVSRIFYRSCASCHHPGGQSFSLMTYREARPWAEAIKQQVLQRRMPPWNAVKGFGEFKDDHGLSQEDLEIVGEWVEGGVPEGNPIYLPPAPSFTVVEAAKPNSARRMEVSGTRIIKHSVEALGIEPAVVPSGGVMQVFAHEPDGAVEPLIWIEKFNLTYNQVYYFREPVRLPSRTRIEIVPPQGSAALLLK